MQPDDTKGIDRYRSILFVSRSKLEARATRNTSILLVPVSLIG
jgi:hypothetical protein